ncbi:MAG: hypothetical protein ACHQM6_02145, partial [Candidatus Kapaibacterium sp.]
MKNTQLVPVSLMVASLLLFSCKTDSVSVVNTGCTVDIPTASSQSSNISVDGKIHVISRNSDSWAYFGTDNELPESVRKFKTLLTIGCFDTIAQTATTTANSIFIRVFDPPPLPGRYY